MPDTPLPYWVFVCNPKKWAIDRFLDYGREYDTWGVRPADRWRFAPGQLAIVRVGVDRRSARERMGRPKLVPGIYALCEVESEAFPGTGANDEFWTSDAARAAGWPTVRIRYLRTYGASPLTIDTLRREKPGVSRLLLNGFQAASFPISADDFHAVMELLGEEVEVIPAGPETALTTFENLAELEAKYLQASPEVKERVSRSIERGPIGALVKKANEYKCQLCAALGRDAVGFKKKNGDPYVEAHHVMPVSKKQVGSLSGSNILTLCANHHRQVHFGHVEIVVHEEYFDILIDGGRVTIIRAPFAAGSSAYIKKVVTE